MVAAVRAFSKGLAYFLFLLCSAWFVPAVALQSERFSLSQPLTIRWLYNSGATVNLTPAVDSTYIYLPLSGGSLIALHLADGEFRWKTEIGGDFSASPVADERGVYVASKTTSLDNMGERTRDSGLIRSLGQKSGVTRWARTLSSPLRGALVADSQALYGGAEDGSIYAFSKETGDILWTKQHLVSFASQPILSAMKLYIGDENGALLALDKKTGRILWRYRTRGALRGRVSAVNGMIYFGSADGYVYALNESNGKLRWRRRTGAGVQAVAYAKEGLIAASLDNFAYFFTANNGSLVWKRQLPGRIAAQPISDQESVLFAPLVGDVCIVLDLRNGKQINTLLVGDGNNTAATPILAGDVILITTRSGLLAFAPPFSQGSSSYREFTVGSPAGNAHARSINGQR